MRNLINTARDIGIALAVCYLWNALMNVLVFHVLDFYPPYDGGNPYDTKQWFFLACIMAPIWEEGVFRALPLETAKAIGLSMRWAIPAAAAIFGLGHGGVLNLLFQGVFGVVNSFIYLKRGYWAAVTTHSLWNFLVSFVI